MSARDARRRLHDLLDAILEIEAFTHGKTLAEYEASLITQRAVERYIEIVSEAARHLPSELKAMWSEIPWRNVADIGNVFRHACSTVDTALVWQVVTEHLPALRTAAQTLLQDMTGDQPRAVDLR